MKPSKKREAIDVDRARRMYDRFGTWRAVANIVRRKDGSTFQTTAISAAVRRADLGLDGRVSP